LPSLQSQWPSPAGHSTQSLGCSGSTLHCNETVVQRFFYDRWQRHLCLDLLESCLQPNLHSKYRCRQVCSNGTAVGMHTDCHCAFFEFLGTFAKLREATVSFVMSVCLSVCFRVTTGLPRNGVYEIWSSSSSSSMD
jgi:hypothetical protein